MMGLRSNIKKGKKCEEDGRRGNQLFVLLRFASLRCAFLCFASLDFVYCSYVGGFLILMGGVTERDLSSRSTVTCLKVL